MPTSSPHTPHLESGAHLSPTRSSSDMSLSAEIGAHRDSSVSEMDLESGETHLTNKTQRDCRICHLSLETAEQDYGMAIELGCSCKGDLGAAHKKCAETWFKIKGNTICEICGATALSIAGEQTNETLSANVAASSAAAAAAPVIFVESQTFWHSRRIMNFLLACMVFAFVVSWLFHFKVLS